MNIVKQAFEQYKNVDWSIYKPEKFEYANGWIKNWFSNFTESWFENRGMRWRSVENYYQAHKTTDLSMREVIASMSPAYAKKQGRLLKIRPDWEDIKYNVMIEGLTVKFQLPEWEKKLIATGDDMIIEWNNWGDKTWGVPIETCKGRNLLGIALMEVRKIKIK